MMEFLDEFLIVKGQYSSAFPLSHRRGRPCPYRPREMDLAKIIEAIV